MRQKTIEALLVILSFPFVGRCDQPELIDRIVAIVNRQIITLSDVEEEKKYLQLGVTDEVGGLDKAAATQSSDFEIVQNLIQQSLMREQVQTSAGNDVTPEEVQEQLRLLEQKFGGRESFEGLLKQRHISMDALKAHIEWQIQVLKFLENRFRQFVVILPKEVEDYYQNSLLPELARKGISQVPPLTKVEGQIRDLLAEEKVNTQIDGWLKSMTQSADIEFFQ